MTSWVDDYSKELAPKSQFYVDGRPVGIPRATWMEAAEDAVSYGYGVWSCKGRLILDTNMGASIQNV